MQRLIFALVCVFAAAPATAAENPNVMATVHQFINGLNKGDIRSALAACAAQSSIVDDFPPHVWHGPKACANWASDFDVMSKKEGITESVVTLGNPRHVDISGDRAYVVVPANYTYKQRRKPVTESGSIFTVALQKVGVRWRITGWAWAKH